MLEFGKEAAPAGDLVIDSSEATFMADVVEASAAVPVIVDFWAPWCGPCKTLGPALEAAVTAERGKVRMVKVNVDENQQIAQQMRVQSIPAVFAFVDGKPVDGFMGAQSPGEISKFVKKIAALGGDGGGGLDEALEMAEQMLADGAAVDAVQTFAAILGEDPTSGAAYAGLVRAHLAVGDEENAKSLLDNVPEALRGAAEIAAVRAQVDLAAAAQDAGPVGELMSTIEAEPDNHQVRLDLATALAATGDAAGAVDQLLELFRRDPAWQDEAAKTQLFKVFDSLDAKDPVVLTGRRRLSSMIFA